MCRRLLARAGDARSPLLAEDPRTRQSHTDDVDYIHMRDDNAGVIAFPVALCD